MNNRLTHLYQNLLRRRVWSLLFFVNVFVCLSAQESDSLSFKMLEPDSTTTPLIFKQPVVIENKEALAKPETYWHPNPNKAMWYSALCPGLGQIYNRSYWKVPVIYGGAAVFSYLISWQGRMYNDYSNAYYDMMDNDPNTVSYEHLFRNINGTDEWKKNTLRKKRDYYRRYRDLCVFGVGILYVVNIIDAFVDGHLYDFSVSNDLSFHIEPVISVPNVNGISNSSLNETQYGLQCSFTF